MAEICTPTTTVRVLHCAASELGPTRRFHISPPHGPGKRSLAQSPPLAGWSAQAQPSRHADGQQQTGSRSAAMPRAEALKFWEGLLNADREAAEELFWDALLRDARADYARRVANDEDRRRARAFEPWQTPAPGSAPPPPPPQQQPAVAPAVQPATVGLRAPPLPLQQPAVAPAVQPATVLGLGVPPAAASAVQTAALLGLRAPPQLAREHEWKPSASGTPLRHPEGSQHRTT
ncbi:hypothetical protein ACP70R_048948 [Stipagrostis hirtigluma subsp. patula]